MQYLDMITKPSDIRKLSFSQLDVLASEIRGFLVSNVSETGGHLASNLGAVELTIAIHNVFDTEHDRLLFDVGHQSYVHKILTGRKEEFSGLRSFGGISGFPKPSESIHDAFTAGHASTSVSTALGMARARTLLGENYHVVTVIGDGAATGGTFYEAMNDAGGSHEPIIVILNDNEMSIAPNVGGFSRYLSEIRLKPAYLGLKKQYRRIMKRIPGGSHIYAGTHKMKNWLRRSLIGTTIFEDMGFLYLGPVDGHDIRKLSYLLTQAKEEKCPVLLHVRTVKGKGYEPAEKNPSSFHGVGKFNPETGVIPNSAASFSSEFGRQLCVLAEQNPRICAITAGMKQGTGLENYAALYPERFFDVGIAEEHAVSMASGMAKQGMIPFVAIYSTFLQRAFDMVFQDSALQKLHVVFCIDRAGLVGEDGETHHGVFDIGYMSQVPGMEIYSPASFEELKLALCEALKAEGPVAIRYPRGSEGMYTGCVSGTAVLKAGSDITLAAYGTMINEVLEAATSAEKLGISAEVIKLFQLKPFDAEELLNSVRRTGALIFAEEQNAPGSIGEKTAALLSEEQIPAAVRLLNLGDSFTTHGKTALLREQKHIDSNSILALIPEVIHEKRKA